jgi:chemotaxis protein MotB
MSTNANPVRPIIVIKKKISHGGHHGGAWKVAYADFVTAMMSLFIVLWLLNSTPQIQKAVAGYFNDPKSNGKETGTSQLGTGETVSIDKQNVEKLKEEIQKAILKQTDLSKISKQIEITVTSEGLKIELIEDKGGTFFQSGSPKLSDTGVALLTLLAGQLKVLPNRLLIEGHTDAQPYSANNAYTNWELSSDRANSARRVLQQGGVGPNQVSQVRGYADQLLHVPSNPLDPSNRRISLIVQWVTAAPPVPGTLPAGLSKAASTATPPASPTTTPEASKSAAAPSPASTTKASPAAKAGPPPSPDATTAAPTPPAVSPNSTPKPPPTAPAVVAKPGLFAKLKAMLPGKKR